MALLKMKQRWTEEDPNTGNSYFVLHSDALAAAGESKCYAKVLRMDVPPDVQRALSDGKAVELELDEAALIPSPKESKSTWPHYEH